MFVKVLGSLSLAVGVLAVGATTVLAAGQAGRPDGAVADKAMSAPAMSPALQNWSAPQFLNAPDGISGSGSMGLATSAGSKGPAKATLDLAVFVPLPPCRLVDTRGVFSPVYAGGPFTAGQIRNYAIPGFCGVPAGSNRMVGVSLQVTTPPTTFSGDIEVIATGQTLGGTVAMVIQAGQWNSVSITPGVNSAGSIQVQLRSTPGDVVIDLNGYYAHTATSNTLDFISISGTYTPDGGLLFVDNTSSTGAAINAFGSSSSIHLAQGTNAIDVTNGDFRVRGAGVNSGTMSFIHKVNTAGTFGAGTGTLCDLGGNDHLTIFSNPATDGNPNAMIQITPLAGTGTNASGFPHNNVLYYAFYNGGGTFCGGGTTTNKWGILATDFLTYTNGQAFNIWVITP